MAFTEFTTDLNIIAAVVTKPTPDNMATSAFKAKFDEGPLAAQTYINDTLLVELAATTDGDSGADNIGATAVTGGTATTVQGIVEEINTASVKIIGNQTVDGIKTFSSSPIVPTPTTDMQATTKAYVDSGITSSPTINTPVINGGDALSATSTELNVLDGITASTAELNLLDGVTATTAELNVLDGIPATLTATEIGYLDGVTSSIQTQFSGTVKTTEDETVAGIKTFLSSPIVPTPTTNYQASTKKYVDDEILTALVGGTQETVQGILEEIDTAKADLASPTFTGTVVLPSTTSIGDVSASEISVLNGLTASTAELNYVDGVTSAIQTQFGSRTYTEDNYVTDGESVTSSIDALDMQAKDTADLVSNKAAKSTSTTATLAAATWTGSAAPYSYTLAVTGVTTTSVQEILPSLSITSAQLAALQAANIQDGGQAAGSVTLCAWGTKPTIDLPIRIILRGDM